MTTDTLISEHNIDTPRHELTAAIDNLLKEQIPSDHKALKLQHLLGIIEMQDTREQIRQNTQALRINRQLVWATWVLAIATIIFIIFD